MREVVSNTSPLLYLHQLGALDLLPRLYERVLVPTAVVTELAEGARGGFDVPTPSDLAWVRVEPTPSAVVLPLVTDLGPGEREAIALAAAHPGALLILDDGLARRHALLLGLTLTGTLGVLLRAKERKLVTAVTPLVGRLEELGFRLAPETRHAVLELAGE